MSSALLSGSGLQVVPGAPEHLQDVAAAREHWEAAREREQLARAVLVAAVEDARTMGSTLKEIAAALGTTRQYVQKVLREAARDHAETEAVRARLARQVAVDERESRRGLAVKRNCFVCGRMKPAPSSVCDYCGDDPVTHNGSRQDFDAAYAGGIR